MFKQGFPGLAQANAVTHRHIDRDAGFSRIEQTLEGRLFRLVEIHEYAGAEAAQFLHRKSRFFRFVLGLKKGERPEDHVGPRQQSAIGGQGFAREFFTAELIPTPPEAEIQHGGQGLRCNIGRIVPQKLVEAGQGFFGILGFGGAQTRFQRPAILQAQSGHVPIHGLQVLAIGPGLPFRPSMRRLILLKRFQTSTQRVDFIFQLSGSIHPLFFFVADALIDLRQFPTGGQNVLVQLLGGSRQRHRGRRLRCGSHRENDGPTTKKHRRRHKAFHWSSSPSTVT